MKRMLLALALALTGLACSAEGDGTFTVVRVDLAAEKLRLFWRDDKGQPLRRPDRLSTWLKSQGKTLVFGMNAGMYHADASPVGLLHEFASFFRDELHCSDALYLDGAVSSLHSPRPGRNDHWHDLGPMFAVVE